jgi:long-chain fatty acid transport protein
MRTKNLCVSFMLLFLLIYPLKTYSSGLTPSGVGAKALSLGGAFRGLADDWSASYWNPAGLAFQTKSDVNFSFMVFSPRPKFTPNVTFGDNHWDVGYKNGMKWYPEDKNLSLPSFSGFLKFPELNGFITGLAFYIPYRSSYKWDLFDPLPGYNNNIPYPEYDHEADVTVLDFHPSVAKQFMEGKLSLGAGISIQKGDLTLRKLDLIPTDFPYPYNTYRPRNLFPVDNLYEGDGWGFGGNLGLLYKASPKFQIGVSVRSPITIKLSGTRELTAYLPMDSTTALKIDLIDPVAANHLRGNTLSSTFESDVKFKLPADFGVGIAYMPYANLTLTCDLNLTTWSSMKELKFEEKGIDPFGNEIAEYKIPLEWKDVTRFSLGLEYRPHTSLALRGGYYLNPTPIPDNTLTPLFFDSGEKSGYTLGIGYKLKSFELGYSYEFTGYQQKFLNPSEDVSPTSLINLPGRYENGNHTSYFTLTYKF